jgi:small subunit ribosomal protein S17
MTKSKTTNTIKNLDELKVKLAEIKLQIRAGQNKNTNAHKKLKKEIAQILTGSATKITMSKQIVGTIKSAKTINTAIVDVVSFKVHPSLKRIKVNNSYACHNTLEAKLGDRVSIKEIRPISKTKHWEITKVL